MTVLFVFRACGVCFVLIRSKIQISPSLLSLYSLKEREKKRKKSEMDLTVSLFVVVNLEYKRPFSNLP